MFKRIDHTAFTVKNRAKSISFYENILGFKRYYEHDVPMAVVEKIVYLKLGDTILEMIHMPDMPQEDKRVFHLCLESDNFDDDYLRLVKAGVEIETEPHIAGAREKGEENWKRAVFIGPDGESIEIRG